MIKVEKLNPFGRMCVSLGMLPSSYKESLTYEEQLLWFCNYLTETVIPTVNNNAEAVEELQSLYNQIKTYVDEYFDNLDIQEEINNKLDDMAESGELTDIIAQYLGLAGILAYNTVADMKAAENLVNGSLVETFGFYSAGDGGNAKYKIRNVTNEDDIDEITIFALNDVNLVAELIVNSKMNVLQFGAKADGETDQSNIFQKAINKVDELFIPYSNNYYLINETLNLKSNFKIYGEKSHLLQPDGVTESIFEINNKKHIVIDNLHLSNETTQTGSTPNLATNLIIYVEQGEDIEIKNCYFENAYSRGIEVFKTKNFNYINNEFKNATFDMLLILPECEDITVDNCIFDTITSTFSYTYLFATGRNDTETYQFSCKNVTVKNSKFLNNPNWEGIDTHACNGFYCYDNYVSNCKIGIIAHYGSTAPVTSDSVKHGDIYIKNNIIVNPSANKTYGMSVGVSGDMNFLCKNVYIEDNYIDGFGVSNTQGSINAVGIRYLHLSNNTIVNGHGPAINFNVIVYADVIGNKCLENTADYGIQYLGGCWFLNVKDNVIKNLSVDPLLYGVRTSLLNISQFVDNDIVATNRYQSNGTLMNGSISSGTTQIGKKGNFVKNEYGIITHYCTDTLIHPAKTETLSSVSLSGTASTNVVTGTNALYYLTEGEEITLQGAGTGGADLTTVITEFIGRDTFIVKDDIKTTFSNQNPKTTASTWVAV